MPRYQIKCTLTTEVTLPEDFDPNLDGEDILYSLDNYTHPKTYQGGWKIFEEAIRVNGEFDNPAYKILA